MGSRPGWRLALFQSSESDRRSSRRAKAKEPNGKVDKKPDFLVLKSSMDALSAPSRWIKSSVVRPSLLT